MGFGPVFFGVLAYWATGILMFNLFLVLLGGIVGGVLSAPFLALAHFGSDWQYASAGRKTFAVVSWGIFSVIFFGSVAVLAAYAAFCFHPIMWR